jgi:hypothetical protein
VPPPLLLLQNISLTFGTKPLLSGAALGRRNIPRLEDAVLEERGERFEHDGRCRRITLARVHPEQPAASAANVSHGSRAAVTLRLMVRPVCPQLRKCSGGYAWCHEETSPYRLV